MVDDPRQPSAHSSRQNEESAFDVSIPVSVISDRSLATLESVVEYLKEKKNLSYHEIAVLLKRDDRTVWTCYSRAKKKRAKEARRG